MISIITHQCNRYVHYAEINKFTFGLETLVKCVCRHSGAFDMQYYILLSPLANHWQVVSETVLLVLWPMVCRSFLSCLQFQSYSYNFTTIFSYFQISDPFCLSFVPSSSQRMKILDLYVVQDYYKTDAQLMKTKEYYKPNFDSFFETEKMRFFNKRAKIATEDAFKVRINSVDLIFDFCDDATNSCL